MSGDDLNGMVPVEWNGRDWIVPKPNLRTELAFKAWLERNALAGIAAHPDILGDDRIAAYQAIGRDCASRHYAYGRPGCIAALADNVNFARLLWYTLTQISDQQGLSWDDMQKFWAARSVELDAAWAKAARPAPAEGQSVGPLSGTAAG